MRSTRYVHERPAGVLVEPTGDLLGQAPGGWSESPQSRGGRNLNSAIKTLIESRVSTHYFDKNRSIADEDLSELVRLATRSPTAYNFQNWRFIAVRTPEGKARLRAAADNQRQVVDAAATFIICGTLAAHQLLPHVLRQSVSAGAIGESVYRTWVSMAEAAHAEDMVLQRDEAVRSASLAAMTLMLAAEGMGLASGPIGGFDAEAVKHGFGLGALDLPVLLVAVGYPASGDWAQKPRRPLRDVLQFA